MSTWQPIKTAPRDEAVLLYSEDWEMTLGDMLVGFVQHDGRCVVAETDDYNATHWMPLPEPPPNSEEEVECDGGQSTST